MLYMAPQLLQCRLLKDQPFSVGGSCINVLGPHLTTSGFKIIKQLQFNYIARNKLPIFISANLEARLKMQQIVMVFLDHDSKLHQLLWFYWPRLKMNQIVIVLLSHASNITNAAGGHCASVSLLV